MPKNKEKKFLPTSHNKGYEVQEIWHKIFLKGSQISFSQILEKQILFQRNFPKLLISLNVRKNLNILTTMNKKDEMVLILALCFVFPTTTYANMVWPALYTETKISSVPIILSSLIIEFFFLKWLFKIDTKKAIYYTALANTASGIIGLILRPLAGIAWELSLGMIVMWLFDWGAFNPVAWFFVPIIGGAVNAFIELLSIKFIWKHEITKKNYLLTWAINIITVAIATIWVILYPPSM